MNANQIREMKMQVREMQTIIDEVSNAKAGEILSIMSETRRAYTATELSEMTEGILSPAQAASVVKSIERLKHGRTRNDRPSKTKYSSAQSFTHLAIRRDIVVRPTFFIQCDQSGQPLNNATIQQKDKREMTYQLVDSDNDRF